MNPQLLIDAVVQQTMVFIAQLATAGGVRAPLAHVANQVFAELTHELELQGVRKKVIADMFGMALRTYHRRIRELRDSQTEPGRTLWEVVHAHIRDHEPVSGRELYHRFRNDDPEIVTGVLNDLVASGLAYRAGRGDEAAYRTADPADFRDDPDDRRQASGYVVWLLVYRNGPVSAERLHELSPLDRDGCDEAISELVADGRIREARRNGQILYECDDLDVPFGAAHGWEAAVLDHFRAMVTAIGKKLSLGRSNARLSDAVGGSTWSLDVYDGHPLQAEALTTLERIRTQLEDLRERVDRHNEQSERSTPLERVVVYVGQYVGEASPPKFRGDRTKHEVRDVDSES